MSDKGVCMCLLLLWVYLILQQDFGLTAIHRMLSIAETLLLKLIFALSNLNSKEEFPLLHSYAYPLQKYPPRSTLSS